MGRNKKTKTAVAVQREESEELSSDPTTPREAPASPSNKSDDEEKETVKAKKVYHGNKISRAQEGKKAKKQTETKTVVQNATADGVSEDKANNAVDNALQQELEEDLTLMGNTPVEVLYCPICTFPAEMCEYSGMYEQCRPWLLLHAKELAESQERGRKRRALTEKERLDRLVQGRGTKSAIDRAVIIEVSQRKGRKMTTSVKGMDLFGHNLKDLVREWKKLFSCGAGVTSSEESKQDWIDIQGNVSAQLIDILPERYSIPKPSIYQLMDKKKVQCYPGSAQEGPAE